MSLSKITSRVEWSASLDPTKAQVPTEETKFHRKVRPPAIARRATAVYEPI